MGGERGEASVKMGLRGSQEATIILLKGKRMGSMVNSQSSRNQKGRGTIEKGEIRVLGSTSGAKRSFLRDQKSNVATVCRGGRGGEKLSHCQGNSWTEIKDDEWRRKV